MGRGAGVDTCHSVCFWFAHLHVLREVWARDRASYVGEQCMVSCVEGREEQQRATGMPGGGFA
eukprot:282215-Chlamydomonas_euryale.AAC.1